MKWRLLVFAAFALLLSSCGQRSESGSMVAQNPTQVPAESTGDEPTQVPAQATAETITSVPTQGPSPEMLLAQYEAKQNAALITGGRSSAVIVHHCPRQRATSLDSLATRSLRRTTGQETVSYASVGRFALVERCTKPIHRRRSLRRGPILVER